MTTQATPKPKQYVPLGGVTSHTVSTDQAAYYLNRRPQTLRGWARKESGPLAPLQIQGRLAWRVQDIKSLLGMEG